MNRWFRLPETGDGTAKNPYRPDLKGHDVDGWSGNESHPDGAPNFIVRVYADSAILDSLANESGVQKLSSVPTTSLNNMFGQNRTDSEWNNSFKIE